MQLTKHIFLVGLTIVLACCHGRMNSSGADQPLMLEDRVSKSQGLVLADSLVLHAEKGQVFYQGQPFHGSAVSYFSNGQQATSIDYVDGRKHGMYKKWFEDGTKSFEANYWSNKQHGLTSSWWRNGHRRSEARYEMGIPNGVQMQWYASGAKFKRIHLMDGKEEGLQQSWRENGKIYNNYEAKNGRIFGLKRATLCYELNNEIVQYGPN